MSSSSLRQHQRRTAMASGGHSPLSRNHSVGAPPHHHSSLPSTTTQRSNTSLPSPKSATADKPTNTTTTATTTATTMTTTIVLPTSTMIKSTDNDNDSSQSAEKSPNSVFQFDHPFRQFHNSSFNSKTSSSHLPRSTRHLCGSIVPLQASTSSPHIDHRSTEPEQQPSSPVSSSSPLRKFELKYRSPRIDLFSSSSFSLMIISRFQLLIFLSY